MVLGKLPEPGRPIILITVGQGPIALAVGAGRGGLDIFTLIYPFSFLSPSLRETTRYRMKYCLKGPLSPKTTNQPMNDLHEIGLKGRLPIFVQNFLSNREFKVRVGSTLSEAHNQEQGVPQGSILSVTLFSLKINNIVKCLNPGVDCSLYVDDLLICYRSKNMNTIERQLQLNLGGGRVVRWCWVNFQCRGVLQFGLQ